MNVATPRCDISPVSQGLEEGPMKKKKFKLFNHVNEQMTEEKKDVSLESSQRVISPGIVDSDETNKTTESNELDGNSFWETNRNEYILERVTEHSVEEISSISKEKSTESILEKVTDNSINKASSKSKEEDVVTKPRTI